MIRVFSLLIAVLCTPVLAQSFNAQNEMLDDYYTAPTPPDPPRAASGRPEGAVIYDCEPSVLQDGTRGVLCDSRQPFGECFTLAGTDKWFCVTQNHTTTSTPNLPQSAPTPKVGGVPYWPDVVGAGPRAAAWCLTKDGNRAIAKKSMRDGNCLSQLATYPWAAPITEHQMGKAAMAMACGSDVASFAGVSIPSESVLLPLLLCQCHNLQAQADLMSSASQVVSALREWGGCS
jgi:hypothetical protein